MKHYVFATVVGVWVGLVAASFIDSGGIHISTFMREASRDVLGYALATWGLHRIGITRRPMVAAALMILILGSLLGSVASTVDDSYRRRHLWEWLQFDTAFNVVIALPFAIAWMFGLGALHMLRRYQPAGRRKSSVL